MARLLLNSLVILSFLALSLAPLAADTLSVDTGLDGQDVQAGWVGISGPSSASGTVTGVFPSTMGSSGNVTVEVRTVQGFRDRGNVTHQIGDVVEDMVYNNNQLGLGLLGLKPGTYYFRSYHNDYVDQGPIDVRMTDAAVSSKVMYQNVPQSLPISGQPVQARAIPLIVQVGASGEASFSWTKKGNDTDNAVLSGFQVTDAPAADLKVDFGTTTSPVLAGWERFGEADGSKLAENWYFTEIGNQGSVRVAVSTDNTSGLGFRNRSGVSTPEGPMLRDFVFYRGQGDLTLDHLLPGRYAVTTYHFDSDNPTTWKPISMSVSDALGSGRALPDVQPNGGTSPTTVATASFEVYSDGVSPVVVHAASVPPSIALYSGLQVIPLDALRVDFGGDSSSNDVQHGFAPFNRPLNSNTSGLQSETYATGLGAAGQVTVSLQAADNVLTWRDRGDVYNPDLGDVAEDFVFDDRWINMTLTDLRQGQYLMSAYFHDKGFNHGSVDVLVSDAAGVDRLVALGVVMPNDDSTPGTASFEFFSDGSNPVAVRFREHDSDSFVMLTGFAVSEIVPEPASLTLAALALSGLGGYVRRRRR